MCTPFAADCEARVQLNDIKIVIMVMISSKAIGYMVPTYKSEMHKAVKEYSRAFQTNISLTSGLQHPKYFLETAEQLHRLSQFENELLESKQELDSRIQKLQQQDKAEPLAKRQRHVDIMDIPDVESPHMILVHVSRIDDDNSYRIKGVRTLYVLNHKTSVGITLQDHYLKQPAKVEALFYGARAGAMAIESLQPNVEDIVYVRHPPQRSALVQMEYANITMLNKGIENVPHTVLGMDDRDALTKLYVSFSKAVKCPEGVLHGRRADFRALYRSVDEKEVKGFDTVTLCDADLGKFVDPEITMGFTLHFMMNSTAEQFDQHKTELLAWQKKEKREEDFIPWHLGWGF